MKSFIVTLLIIEYFVEISQEFSHDLDSNYLFQLDNGCKNVDIRFDYRYFERLSKCKTIHGYLRISDMDIPHNASLNFEDIYEVTGYVLIDNVSGLKSVGQLFPNISVIRGEILHQGFSLVITNNIDLENIGTGLMTYIMNGDVRIENNNKLCYIQSVDWVHLRKGLVLINENNNNNCNNSCSKCWSEDISQLICGNCETCSISDNTSCCDEECIGGCKENLDDCIACKNFKYNDGNSTLCTNYQPLTFELENYFLVDGETCDQMDRTRLDEKCIRKDECPLEDNHFFNKNDSYCSYCDNCTLTKCSISIKSLDDLDTEACHIASGLEIINLEDSMEIDFQTILMKELKNIVEIQGCLSIRNSSAITNLNFLKRLKKVTGHDGSSCDINGVKYSVILENNDNLQSGFDGNLEIFVAGGVRIENNKNLCKNEVKRLENVFKLTSNDSVLEIQTRECNYPKINVHTLVTENSTLILMDTIRSSKHKIQLVYWIRNVEKVEDVTSSYHQIKNLEPYTVYPFKIVVLNEFEEILYTTNYHFFKTLYTNEPIHVFKSSSELDTVNLNFVYRMPLMKFAESDEEISVDDPSNFIYYITYQKIKKDFCTKPNLAKTDSSNTSVANLSDEMTQTYDEYYLRDPNNQIKNFDTLNHMIINSNQTKLNITNLINSTCYRFDILPCKKSNILMCSKGITIAQETQTPLKMKIEQEPNSFSNLIWFIIVIAIISVGVIYFAYLRTKKDEKSETYLELQNRKAKEVDQWELARENIVQTKVLGRGEFGIVYQGYIMPDEKKLYAIKTLAPFKEAFEENFIKEAQIMSRFNTHHVVKLIGYCTKDRPLLVIMEFMMHGDLKKFIQRNRPVESQNGQNLKAQGGSYTTAPISKSTLHPIRPVHQMAIEIADGMMYLEDIKFIHCDLACRNLMVNESYTIKIGDFGLARELYHTDYYKPGSRNKKIPLRWMAPEALGNEEMLPRYTSKSDVFSYGIVLYELVTFCETPYAGCLDEEVIEIIKIGRTLDKPKDCDDKIYELMQKCWQYDPNERIAFKEIIEYLLEKFDIPNFKNVSYYHTKS